MPSSSLRPCRAYPCGELVSGPGGYCPKHARGQARQTDARRGTRTQRGYNARWARARLTYLSSHPLCETCQREGRTTPATDVDHRVPHRGDSAVFWDEGNWQPLCHPCHSRKTAREDGRFGTVAQCPRGLRPLVPLVVVCGPPGAGKSLLVSRHARDGELVLGLEALEAELSGLPLYTATDAEWKDRAMQARNARLWALCRAPVPWPRAWLMTGAPLVTERRWWRHEVGARVLLLAPPLDVCRQRLSSDERLHNLAAHIEAAESWWRAYSADPYEDEAVEDAGTFRVVEAA